METNNFLSAVAVTSANLQHFSSFFPKEYLAYIENGDIQGVGVIYENVACGVMLTSISPDIINLYWIYIAEDYRRKGLATFLHSKAGIYASVHKLTINTILPITSNQEELLSFLRSLGYKLEEQGSRFCFRMEDVDVSHFKHEPTKNVYSLQEVSSIQSFLHDLEKNNELLIDTEEVSEMSSTLSSVIINKGKLEGCILIRQDVENTIEISFLYIHGETTAQSAMRFINLISHCIENAKKEGLSPATIICASCITPVGVKFVKTFVKNAEETVFYRATLSGNEDKLL